jgi:hypothetical protein
MQDNRTLNRKGARELTAEEIAQISGSGQTHRVTGSFTNLDIITD